MDVGEEEAIKTSSVLSFMILQERRCTVTGGCSTELCSIGLISALFRKYNRANRTSRLHSPADQHGRY